MGLLVSRTSGNSANRPTLPPSMDSIKTKTRKKHRVRLPSSSRSSFHHDRTRTAGLHAEQFRNISSAVPSAPCTVRMLCRVVSSSPPLFLPRFETCRTVTLSSLSPLSILVATADRSPHPPLFFFFSSWHSPSSFSRPRWRHHHRWRCPLSAPKLPSPALLIASCHPLPRIPPYAIADRILSSSSRPSFTPPSIPPHCHRGFPVGYVRHPFLVCGA